MFYIKQACLYIKRPTLGQIELHVYLVCDYWPIFTPIRKQYGGYISCHQHHIPEKDIRPGFRPVDWQLAPNTIIPSRYAGTTPYEQRMETSSIHNSRVPVGRLADKACDARDANGRSVMTVKVAGALEWGWQSSTTLKLSMFAFLPIWRKRHRNSRILNLLEASDRFVYDR